MPIEGINCDGGIGLIITASGVLSDGELIDCLHHALGPDAKKAVQYRYIFIDNTSLRKVLCSDETLDRMGSLCQMAANANPDTIVAMALDVTMEADVDLIQVISRMHALYVHPTCWEVGIFRIRVEALNWIEKMAAEKFGIEGIAFERT